MVAMGLMGSLLAKRVDHPTDGFTLASALSSYLRHRAICGDQIQRLIGMISTPAH